MPGMRMLRPFACVLALAVAFSRLGSGEPPHGVLTVFKAPGMVDAQIQLPSIGGKPPRLLLGYTYDALPLDVVLTDPATNQCQVLNDPGTGELGVKGVVVLKDGTVYLGTYPRGHVLKLPPGGDHLIDLGRPCPKDPELWIWDLAVGADGKIYGATSPSAKLIRIDPGTGRMECLGRVDPLNTVARNIVRGPRGYLYISTGFIHPQVTAFDTLHGTFHPLLSPELASTSSAPRLFLDPKGRVIVRTGIGTFVTDGLTLVALPGPPPDPIEPSLAQVDIQGHLLQKQVVHASSAEVSWHDAGPIAYSGKARSIFRLAAGGDGCLYASTAYPGLLLRIDPRTAKVSHLGLLGPGEAYEMAGSDGHLFIAAYSAFRGFHALDFTESMPFLFSAEAQSMQSSSFQNPVGITFRGMALNWRPKAMALGPNGLVYIGAVAGYGQSGGTVFEWNPEHHAASPVFHDPDLSVISLAETPENLALGLSTEAGTGGKSQASEGKLAIWDFAQKRIVHEAVPVPGASQVDDLVATSDGRIFGVAGASEVFVYLPATRTIQRLGSLPMHCAGSGINLFSSAGIGPDGNIYGLAKEGIFKIDTHSGKISTYAMSQEPITAGFAIIGDRIYYGSSAALCWAELPHR